MKIIALGDTHGKPYWKKIITSETFDKIIFMGDYLDSFDISKEDQINNFLDILEYKRANKEKVVLLIGNHDYHYMMGVSETYSGFSQTTKVIVEPILEQAIKERLFQICFEIDDFLFSHAGVTKTWCRDNEINMKFPVKSINNLFKESLTPFSFNGWNPYGDDITQSPLWVRLKSLLNDRIDRYVQVVGHTRVNRLDITGPIVLIDTLDSTGEYLILENGELSVGKYTK